MAEACLQAKLADAKAQVQMLKDRVRVGKPTVHKDLSLITLFPKWTGTDAAVTLEWFISSVDSSAALVDGRNMIRWKSQL